MKLNQTDDAVAKSIRNSANWFLWICILSFLNSMAIYFKVDFGFIAGLGFTRIIEVFLTSNRHLSQVYFNSLWDILSFSIPVYFIFLVIWFGASRYNPKYFFAGIFLYLVDGIAFFFTGNYYAMLIHGAILIELIYGYILLFKYLQTQKKML